MHIHGTPRLGTLGRRYAGLVAAVAATTDMSGAVRPPLGGAGGGGSRHHIWGGPAKPVS